MTDRTERPNRIPWPPVIFFACLVGGWMIDDALPLRLSLVPDGLKVAGALGIGAGLGLISWTTLTFGRSGTTILPHAAATKLLTSGPFAWSRNPIYLGEASLIAGFGLLKGSLWLLIAAMTFVNLVTLLAVIREEAHLAARFGEDWQAYARKVRRWL